MKFWQAFCLIAGGIYALQGNVGETVFFMVMAILFEMRAQK